MIVQRFRPIGMVAGVAVAATGLYLVSLKVAAERGRVEAVDRQIAAVRHDMFALQTELGTRASLRQLERWNGDVLALSAPTASQFVHDDAQLASLDASMLPVRDHVVPSVMVATYTPPPAPAAPAIQLAALMSRPAKPTPVVAPVAKPAIRQAKPVVTAAATKPLTTAAVAKSKHPVAKPTALAGVKPAKVAAATPKPKVAPAAAPLPRLQRTGFDVATGAPRFQRASLVRGQ